jgi:glycosyltransferase involved in cell wall biosynthesis
MKLLIITNNPANASFRQRVELHVPVLQDSGFDCTVAPLPSGSGGRRSLFRRAADCDGVLLHKKALNLHDAFFLRRHSRKIVYDFDDAVMYKAQTPDSRGGSRLRAFRRTVRLADLVIAGNQYLAEHARRYHASVEILPTGLDVSAYNIGARPKPDDRVRLVWIGGGATLRYLRDIGPALEDLGSRFPHVVLRIICDTFFDLKNLPVEKCRWSQQTQVSDLVSSDIALAPLPDDRFTRGKCGFKILQYAAAGLPVVASPVGVSAEYVQDGVTGFHAGGMSAWVDGIGRLVQDVKLRTAMGRAAEMWVRQFDANSIEKRLVEILQRHLGEGQTHARAN